MASNGMSGKSFEVKSQFRPNASFNIPHLRGWTSLTSFKNSNGFKKGISILPDVDIVVKIEIRKSTI